MGNNGTEKDVILPPRYEVKVLPSDNVAVDLSVSGSLSENHLRYSLFPCRGTLKQSHISWDMNVGDVGCEDSRVGETVI